MEHRATMAKIRETLSLWGFSLLKIPLIFLVSPRVVEVTDKRCEIIIPLNRLTRNHLGSMYFGTLAIGADCAGGLFAVEAIKATKKNVVFIFKDFKAEFLKRPESDVHFVCEDGEKVKKAVAQAVKTKQRVNSTVKIMAYAPKKSGKDPVAEFDLTLSLKLK